MSDRLHMIRFPTKAGARCPRCFGKHRGCVVIYRAMHGKSVKEAELRSNANAAIRDAAKKLGISVDTLLDALGCFPSGKRRQVHDLLLPAPEAVKPATLFRVRGSRQPAAEAVEFVDIFGALECNYDSPDPVVEWDGIDEWCCLDLDFHEGSVPDANDVRIAADTVRPMPRAWWLSKGGGLHAMFSRIDNGSAGQLASLAAVGLLDRFPAADVELKCSTRQPPGEIVRCVPDRGNVERIQKAESLGKLDFTVWLTDRELVPGQRYPHEHCPVNPSPRALGNSDPVRVFDDHIYCLICNADGIKRGSKTAGYFPLAVLAGIREKSMLAACVDNFTHWDHAKHIVTQVIKKESIAETVYSAMLKQKHGDDPRIPLVFTAAPKTGLVRHPGFWADNEGAPIPCDTGSAILASLPACQRIDEGELKVNRKVVEVFARPVNLAAYGYPALTRVWGLQLTFMQEQPHDRIFTVLQKVGTPEYLPTSRRIPEGEAWDLLESLFPGFNRAAVELLVAAKGCSEFSAGLPPMIFLTGPTGAGKTQSVNLAAAICGDSVRKVRYSRDEDRVYQGLAAAKQNGSFAFFDEYIKSAKSRGVNAAQAMEVVLPLDGDALYHMLYVGAVALGDLPVCVWADTSLPEDVITHSQLARRIHHVRLRESHNWKHNAAKLRADHGPEVVHAADSLLSWIIDRWFPPGPATDFAAVASALGFGLLRDDEAAKNKEELIRRVFDLVCKEPDVHVRGMPGAGWKEIKTSVSGELSDLWTALESAGRAQELDLKRVIGLAHSCDLETKETKGGKLYVRFIDKQGGRVNEQLRVHGFRDAIRG